MTPHQRMPHRSTHNDPMFNSAVRDHIMPTRYQHSQSNAHPSFWLVIGVTRVNTRKQIAVMDDFGSLVGIGSAQTQISLA